MQKAHANINWENEPSDATPINEQNLNQMDVSIDVIDDRVITLDTTKFDKTDAQGLIKSLTFNRTNGVFTITYFNGATATIDTMLEKLAVNFDFDETTQQMIITLDDGTVKRVDLSAFIAPLEFVDSDTTAFQILADGKVTAIVKEGSIQEKHLRPDYLADIRVETAKSEAYKNAAAISASTASVSAYNAKESEKAAKESQTEAKKSEVSSADSATSASASKQAAATSATQAAESASAAKDSEDNSRESETNAKESENKSIEMADMAESYAVGTGGRVRENDATDNSKYYSEQSRDSATSSAEYYEKVKQEGNNALDAISGAIDNINQGLPRFVINFEDGKLYYSSPKFTFVVNKTTGNLDWGLAI